MRSRIFRHAHGIVPILFVIAQAFGGCEISYWRVRFSLHGCKRSDEHEAVSKLACVISVGTIPILTAA